VEVERLRGHCPWAQQQNLLSWKSDPPWGPSVFITVHDTREGWSVTGESEQQCHPPHPSEVGMSLKQLQRDPCLHCQNRWLCPGLGEPRQERERERGLGWRVSLSPGQGLSCPPASSETGMSNRQYHITTFQPTSRSEYDNGPPKLQWG
jgi:hypothetical protein